VFDTLRNLKTAKAAYQIQKVDNSEVKVDAKLTWYEYDRLTGVATPREESMSLDELKAHKANLEARLAAIDETLGIIEPIKEG